MVLSFVGGRPLDLDGLPRDLFSGGEIIDAEWGVVF